MEGVIVFALTLYLSMLVGHDMYVTNGIFLIYFRYNSWQIPEGNGSGVVWDEQGHIVTNYHGMSL